MTSFTISMGKSPIFLHYQWEMAFTLLIENYQIDNVNVKYIISMENIQNIYMECIRNSICYGKYTNFTLL